MATPGYSSREQSAELVTALEARPPAVIVDAGSREPGAPGFLPLLIDRPPLAGDGRTFDALDPVRAVVRQHYRLAEIIDGWPVYVRVSSLSFRSGRGCMAIPRSTRRA